MKKVPRDVRHRFQENLKEFQAQKMGNEREAINTFGPSMHPFEGEMEGQDSESLQDSGPSDLSRKKRISFIKFVDALDLISDAQTLCNLFAEIMEIVGWQNVVHMITDNAANYKAAGRVLNEKNFNKSNSRDPIDYECIDNIDSWVVENAPSWEPELNLDEFENMVAQREEGQEQRGGQNEDILFLRELVERDHSDPVLFSKLGHVRLQMGDLDGARATFARMEKLVKGHGVELENLAERNRALEHPVNKDYASAVREYDKCIERDPGNVVALNNKALCLLYSRDLSDSIKSAGRALERVPMVAMKETLVVNLCRMYELAYVNNGEVDKSLSNWIAGVAPYDFDPSCTRI
ncbi:uncharacterized protein LOC120276061 [Dioscorea cayenensis subsp. rotundata]|uniref:Uncharacterized protein LOC120276061 n=1 Tax=Dioscorea cayennensis subsp. rotundata TaxID=55577 RepID=A0AB40CGP3_DIOCR|nr:uncharacterized protein LOC120276061 [Dioscorea cayenensis subsp. rotundata]